MKNKVVMAVLIVTVALAGVSCASGPQVSRVDANTQVDLSGRWNDTDVRTVCETLLEQALSSPRVDTYIRDYSTKTKGNIPTVIVGRFRNTSSEHIDTSIIAGVMRTAIINSGKLEFVEGGDARDEVRMERQDQQGNAGEDSAARLANETGANFMLTGEVKAMVDKAGNTTVRSYFVKATLTNIETNRILWEGENNDIKKVITQPKTKL